MPKKLIGVIDEELKEHFKQQQVCKKACQEIIQELVAEYEKAIHLQERLWDVVAKKFKVVRSGGSFELCRSTGEVFLKTGLDDIKSKYRSSTIENLFDKYKTDTDEGNNA